MPESPRNPGNVTMRGVQIIFRNFRGEAGQFNREGVRNFAVLLDDQIAETLAADGWNVKTLAPRDDDEDGTEQAYLPVDTGFDKGRPPMIYLVTSRGRTLLTVDTVSQLDGVDIANVDLIVRPHVYNNPDRSGIKAYVKTMVVTIEEDELMREIAHLDDAQVEQ